MNRTTRDPQQPRAEGALLLRDGRSLGFAQYGERDGAPILWFHATPRGRRQLPPLARSVAVERGVRLVGLERPGVGGSTPRLYDLILEEGA
jgi:hypothetical protein